MTFDQLKEWFFHVHISDVPVAYQITLLARAKLLWENRDISHWPFYFTGEMLWSNLDLILEHNARRIPPNSVFLSDPNLFTNTPATHLKVIACVQNGQTDPVDRPDRIVPLPTGVVGTVARYVYRYPTPGQPPAPPAQPTPPPEQGPPPPGQQNLPPQSLPPNGPAQPTPPPAQPPSPPAQQTPPPQSLPTSGVQASGGPPAYTSPSPRQGPSTVPGPSSVPAPMALQGPQLPSPPGWTSVRGSMPKAFGSNPIRTPRAPLPRPPSSASGSSAPSTIRHSPNIPVTNRSSVENSSRPSGAWTLPNVIRDSSISGNLQSLSSPTPAPVQRVGEEPLPSRNTPGRLLFSGHDSPAPAAFRTSQTAPSRPSQTTTEEDQLASFSGSGRAEFRHEGAHPPSESTLEYMPSESERSATRSPPIQSAKGPRKRSAPIPSESESSDSDTNSMGTKAEGPDGLTGASMQAVKAWWGGAVPGPKDEVFVRAWLALEPYAARGLVAGKLVELAEDLTVSHFIFLLGLLLSTCGEAIILHQLTVFLNLPRHTRILQRCSRRCRLMIRPTGPYQIGLIVSSAGSRRRRQSRRGPRGSMRRTRPFASSFAR